MQKLMKHLHKNEKGFTLVELMVVVVIIGILVAIAVPIYNNVTDRANEQADAANLRTIQGAITMWQMADEANDPDELTVGADGVGLEDFIPDWPTSPGAYTVVAGVATSDYGDAEEEEE